LAFLLRRGPDAQARSSNTGRIVRRGEQAHKPEILIC